MTDHSAVSTSLQQATISYAYTNNGLVDYFDDASGNRTNLTYDGFDRLLQTNYPVTTVGAYAANSSDYEQVTYDAYGLVTTERRRDGQTISYSYDNLSRVTFRDTADRDVTTSYDLFSRAVSLSQAGSTVSYAYDALSRVTRQTENTGYTDYLYDTAGRRTRLTWPDQAFYVDYDYLVTGEMTKIRENGASSGVGVLATFAYDDLGRRTSLTRGNGIVTSYTFDSVSRLASLTQNASGTSHDNTLSFGYNPASQIASRTRTNSVYDWATAVSSTTSYADNGLNQYTAVGSVTPTYDGAGNLTTDGAKTYGYNQDNQLRSISGGVVVDYDPLGRLRYLAGGSTTRFAYDGADMIAELNAGGDTILRRYVHGPRMDEPLVWYEGSGTSDRRWLMADERGSIIGIANDSGTVTSVNKYDEYGAPASGNLGRFQYTGQMWLAEAGLYHYKARAYHPGVGRFLQTDPIGIAGGMNLYGYVGNDPVNKRDPSGLCFNAIYHYTALFRGNVYINGSLNLTGITCLDPISEGLAWFGGYAQELGGAGGAAGDAIQDAAENVAEEICAHVPDARVINVSGSVAVVAGLTGGGELLVNYNTGQIAGFKYGGGELGTNVGPALTAGSSFVYGIGEDNSLYAGGFTTNTGCVFAICYSKAQTSGGFRNLEVPPNSSVQSFGLSLSAGADSVMPFGALSRSWTDYSQPKGLGKFWAMSPIDVPLFALKQACNG